MLDTGPGSAYALGAIPVPEDTSHVRLPTKTPAPPSATGSSSIWQQGATAAGAMLPLQPADAVRKTQLLAWAVARSSPLARSGPRGEPQQSIPLTPARHNKSASSLKQFGFVKCCVVCVGWGTGGERVLALFPSLLVGETPSVPSGVAGKHVGQYSAPRTESERGRESEIVPRPFHVHIALDWRFAGLSALHSAVQRAVFKDEHHVRLCRLGGERVR